MCLRFVFLLITRVAAGLRLSRREEMWKTAEILILRHQLSVLQRRQPRRPKLDWADRALLADPARRHTESAAPRTAAADHPGHDRALAPRHRPPPLGRQVRARQEAGQRPGATSGPWSGGWLARTPTGDTAGSTANWPDSASRSQRRPCGRSSRPAASTPAGGRPGRPGHNSCAPRPRPSWLRLLHRRPARRHPGLCPGRHRARDPAHPHPRHHPASHRRMDHPAGPQPDHGSRRPRASGSGS